ncbi:hypothetical protein PGTUg99_025810 [Puccinia graminis f. sp. tritici]|uniref:Uncharacterized protein n=1 Tax=Puccinia graminis f. sp. tritici TaxID=56615 RepID=A0A5B0NHI7_PUCGR|nr:hypothetical protein PGTUg99_025810 [Puccinia graminis f. sp. tritici]
MQVRANAFAHRVRSAGETKWTDNYYAPGGSHDGIDPDTGRERPPLRSVSHNGYGGRDRGHQGRTEDRHSRPFDNNRHLQAPHHGPYFRNNHQGSLDNYGHQSGQGYSRSEHRYSSGLPSEPSESRKRLRGYQGSNFNEGYVDKRNVAGKQAKPKAGGSQSQGKL